jgi:transcriptional regulator of acetoin/glycerol metabolism
METKFTNNFIRETSELEQLRIAWQEYVQHSVILPYVNHQVADSWQRCRLRLNPFQHQHINPLSADNLLATQVASFNLISVARPVLEDIYQYIEHSNTAIILTNGAGYILDVLGDINMMKTAEQFGFTTGAITAESQSGTNAFALAITERIPIRVRGGEHFLQQFHELAGVASPIFDVSGRPMGTLGLLNLANQQHPHSLGLTIAGARAIEGQHQTDLLLGEQNSQLAGLNAILAAISDGILVWNAEGILLHINTAATKIFDMPSKVLVGRQINEFINFPLFIQEALHRKEPLTDVEANLTIDQRTVSCVLSLRFVINNNDLQSTIVTLRQEKDVRQLVQRQVGAQALTTMEDITGDSPEIRRMIRQAKTAAEARASILLRGESGTGKNVLASAIHNESSRRDGPFLIFACSTVPNELVVSELLGFDEGMTRKRPGGRPSKFELANGGTIFFQDVDALPLEAQAILLNVLDLGIVQRLGSDRPIPVDVRVIAAPSANANVEKLISQGNFRADLYYRLSSFEINIPPLRSRPRDIPLLVDKILVRLSRQLNRPLSLAPGMIEVLKKYPWPGNIRELEAVLGRAAVHAGVSEIIGPMHLPDFVHHPIRLNIDSQDYTAIHSLSEIERQALLQTARLCNGNVSQMAKVLEIGRTTVWRKLKEFGISPEDFRTSPSD